MVDFASSEKNSATLYRLMTSVIVPRPIALVATRDIDGVANLAPFSFFNGVSDRPPTLAFSVGSREGVQKDTTRNIETHPEFIVHLVGEDLVTRMNSASADYPHHVDEFEAAGFQKTPGTIVNVPRAVEAPVALECRLVMIVPIGRPPLITSHIIGEIIYWHLAESIWAGADRVITHPMQPIGRLGPAEYARLHDRFMLPRPGKPVSQDS
jgi:flavin reductase (DIM6/NTAB) family NADH-FMN oxidoreductase RutF